MNLKSIRFLTRTAAAAALAATLAYTSQAQQNQTQTPDQERDQPVRPGQRPGLEPKQGQYRPGTLDDHAWIKHMSQDNLFEVRLGELVGQKSDHASVKQYGDRLAKDHKKSNDKLEQIALKQGVMLEKQLDSKHQQMLDKFQSYSGEELNREFAKHAIKGHVKEIAHFQQASQEAKDEDLRTFAREALPILRQHLEEARDIAKAVGIDEATITSLIQEQPSAVGKPGVGTEIERGAGEKKNDLPKDEPLERNRNNQPKK